MIPPGGVEDPPAGGTASLAFPKDLRLLRRGDFRRVYEEGQRRSGSLCAVFFRANGLARTRLGITTPARLGNAVLRNRVKRRLREFFRLHRAALPAGWDIVLNPREAVAQVPFTTLAREMLRLFPSQPPPTTSGNRR
jgi:ribonuclease P protein component